MPVASTTVTSRTASSRRISMSGARLALLDPGAERLEHRHEPVPLRLPARGVEPRDRLGRLRLHAALVEGRPLALVPRLLVRVLLLAADLHPRERGVELVRVAPGAVT